jgi:hypothetical protein
VQVLVGGRQAERPDADTPFDDLPPERGPGLGRRRVERLLGVDDQVLAAFRAHQFGQPPTGEDPGRQVTHPVTQLAADRGHLRGLPVRDCCHHGVMAAYLFVLVDRS